MLNHITLMGRLVRDPELRSTQSGVSVVSFTVAVDRDYSGRDGGEKQTDFIDCSAWRQTGEFVSKYFRKGSMIVVSGRLQSRKWQDKEGNNRVSWEAVADNVYFGENKKDSETGSYQPPATGYPQSMPYSAPAVPTAYTAPPAPRYQQQTFRDITPAEDDGELPF